MKALNVSNNMEGVILNCSSSLSVALVTFDCLLYEFAFCTTSPFKVDHPQVDATMYLGQRDKFT